MANELIITAGGNHGGAATYVRALSHNIDLLEESAGCAVRIAEVGPLPATVNLEGNLLQLPKTGGNSLPFSRALRQRIVARNAVLLRSAETHAPFSAGGEVEITIVRNLKVWRRPPMESFRDLARRQARYFVASRTIKRSGSIVAPTGFMAAQVAERLGKAIDHSHIQVIPFGVEGSASIHRHRRWTSGPIDVTWVGALSPHKAPIDAIGIVSELQKAGHAATLTFVGRGRDSVLKELSDVGLGHGVPVRFAGEVSRNCALLIMARAHCLLVTSAFESWCHPVAEALAVGTPVVAPDVGPYEELGVPADATFRQGDYSAAANAIIRASSGRVAFCGARFTWPDHFRSLGELVSQARISG